MISKTNGTSVVGTTTVNKPPTFYSGTNIQSLRLNSSADIPNSSSSAYNNKPLQLNLSYTTSLFEGQTNNSTVKYEPMTYNLSNLSSFETSLKSQPINIQLQTLASNISSIGNSISSISSYFDVSNINQIQSNLQTINQTIKEIIPYATDEQINTIQLQQQQENAMHQEYQGIYNMYSSINPNHRQLNTSFETSLLHSNGNVDWGMVVESGGSLYAATKKFEQYSNLLQDSEGLTSFGEELFTNVESYSGLLTETLGMDVSEGVLSSFGIEGVMSTLGVGALEVGTLAAGGLATVAALAILGASYGLYKAFGGSEDLPGIWNDAANYFGNLFSP